MRILCLADEWDGDAPNGACAWARNALPIIAERASEVVLCTPVSEPSITRASASPVPKNTTHLKVRTPGDRLDPGNFHLYNRVLRAELEARELYQNIDVIYDIGAYMYSHQFLEWIKDKCEATLVVHCMLSFSRYSLRDFPPLTLDWMRKNQVQVFRTASKVLCLSEAELNTVGSLDEAFPSKLAISTLGTEFPLRRPRESHWRRMAHRAVIGFVGRSDAFLKGFDVFSEAMRRLQGQDSRFEVVVAGNEGAEDYFDEANAEEKTWLGRAELIKLLDRLHFLVMPSRYEALGLVAIEAMARGVVVITSSRGGLAEVVRNDRNGVLLEDDEGLWVEEVVCAIDRLSQAPDECMRIAVCAVDTVKERWTLQRSVDELWSNLLAAVG